ncbi:MAG TPA: hypothetical protein VHQ01_11555 [Pyrinomonadaceae bacterium]|jgi:hypothetical protein|nr:hypothetical protein [Pyrinomonadaceae bacterium]
MKKLVANLFIALVVLGGIPSFGLAAVESSNDATADSVIDAGYYRVPANSVQTHRVFLNAGSAVISISGDGDTDLDMYVYDGNGNIVVRSESNYDDEAAYLTVYRTGYFFVKVVNRGNVYNDYAIVVR